MDEIRKLCNQILADCSWFRALPAGLQSDILARSSPDVANAIAKVLNDHMPQWKKYERPDDVGWAGWYELDGELIGHRALDGRFFPVPREE